MKKGRAFSPTLRATAGDGFAWVFSEIERGSEGDRVEPWGFWNCREDRPGDFPGERAVRILQWMRSSIG